MSSHDIPTQNESNHAVNNSGSDKSSIDKNKP